MAGGAPRTAPGGAVAVRLHRRRVARLRDAPGRRSPTSTPRSRPSPGRGATRSSPGWPMRRSGGSSTTPARSSGASAGAAAGTTGWSCSTRPATATAPARGRSTKTCRRCSRTSPRSPARGPPFVALSAHTAGYDGGPARGARARRVRDHGGRRGPPAPREVGARSSRSAPGPVAPGIGGGPSDASSRSSRAPRTRASSRRSRCATGAARDEAGLTLVDGARELSRALDGGAQVAEVFVDETALDDDGRDGRRPGARRRGATITPVGGVVLGRLAYGDRSEGLVATVRIPELRLDAPPAAGRPAGRRARGRREARQPRARCCGARTARAPMPSSSPTRAPTRSTPTPSGPRSAPCSPGRWRPRRRATRSPGCGPTGIRVLAARVDGAVPYTEVDLRGGVALVLGSEAEGLTDAWTGRRRHGDPAPDARRRRQPQRLDHRRRSCCTRRDASAAFLDRRVTRPRR